MNVQTFDFAAARQALVDSQVRVNDVTDKHIQAAFRRVPREAFAPAGLGEAAYSETDIEIAPGRWLWRARDSSKLLQSLEPQAGQSALVIGGGLGYIAAILTEIGLKVTALEADEARASAMRAALKVAGFSSVEVVSGNLRAGIEGKSFDLIYVDGGVVNVEKAWLDQLAEGGRLGVVVRDRAAGHARIYRKSNNVTGHASVFEAMPPILPEFEPAPAFKF
jgi:protein-L-isoaspartate(D-aspartate) O-methyltransferase